MPPLQCTLIAWHAHALQTLFSLVTKHTSLLLNFVFSFLLKIFFSPFEQVFHFLLQRDRKFKVDDRCTGDLGTIAGLVAQKRLSMFPFCRQYCHTHLSCVETAAQYCSWFYHSHCKRMNPCKDSEWNFVLRVTVPTCPVRHGSSHITQTIKNQFYVFNQLKPRLVCQNVLYFKKKVL